jgi:beta-galactosidase
MPKRLQVWKQSSKDFKVTEVNAVKENDHGTAEHNLSVTCR